MSDEKLRAALAPFAILVDAPDAWQPAAPDSLILWQMNQHKITLGMLRAASAALRETAHEASPRHGGDT